MDIILLLYDNGRGFDLSWGLAYGATYTSGSLRSAWTTYANGDLGPGQAVNLLDSTSNEFFITGIQIEVDHTGSGVATDFEHRSYGQELALCQRYYQTAPGDTIMVYNNNTASWLFPVAMRAAPTMTLIGLSGSGAALASTANGFRQSASNSQSSGIGYTADAEL